MPEHSSRQLIQTLDSVRTALEPLSAVQRAMDTDPGIRDLLAAANRSHQALRPLLGPVEDLRRSGLIDAAGQFATELEGVTALAAQIQKSYRLPELAETIGHLQSLELRAIWRTLDRSTKHTASLQRAAARLTAPWLDTAAALRSVTGFCELQGIGRLLREAGAFDPGPAGRLRLVLGDWRGPMDWPAPIFADPLARSDFYLDRGLDPALTAFPAKAFDQIVTSAGLKGTLPSVVSHYSPEPNADNEDEEAGFERTNAAHDRLQRFETLIRQFIERTMRAAFGNDWIKQGVPASMQADWSKKKDRARDRGEPEHPLIAYADFTDYKKIILRNWHEVFVDTFKCPTLVQESFQRLYPIRVCTMHARLVTQDDELYLYVETQRLLAAIGIAS